MIKVQKESFDCDSIAGGNLEAADALARARELYEPEVKNPYVDKVDTALSPLDIYLIYFCLISSTVICNGGCYYG
jgi:hypothetical protein